MAGVHRIPIAVVILFGLIPFEGAHAIDLSGAWATSAEQCREVFVGK